MSSKSETGHAKNVANFGDLITRIESLGTSYNPSKTGLQLTNLKAQHDSATASLLSLAAALPLYQQAVDFREAIFLVLKKRVTRSLNMFKALVDNPLEAESATAYAKKVRGFKVSTPKATEGEEPVRKISTSQQSFDMQIANFEQFVQILAAHPAYAPNEEDLKITSLNTLLEELKSKSQAVTIAQANVDKARSSRNTLLYTKGTGLVDTGRIVKTYIKAAFTSDSLNYKPILSLEFRHNKV
ncbi:MAG: hypothetical protein ACO1N7_13755 [Sphingobacteriaceae bacterium]